MYLALSDVTRASEIVTNGVCGAEISVVDVNVLIGAAVFFFSRESLPGSWRVV